MVEDSVFHYLVPHADFLPLLAPSRAMADLLGPPVEERVSGDDLALKLVESEQRGMIRDVVLESGVAESAAKAGLPYAIDARREGRPVPSKPHDIDYNIVNSRIGAAGHGDNCMACTSAATPPLR